MNKGDTLRKQKVMTEEQLSQLRAIISELKDVSDYELQKKIENHQIDLDAAYQELASLKERLTDERDAQDKQEKLRSRAQMQNGNLQAQKDRYDENLVNRQKLIQEIATRHNIAGYDHDLSAEECIEFVERLEANIRKQGTLIEKIKSEGRAKADERTAEIQTVKVERSAADSERKSVEQQIVSLP